MTELAAVVKPRVRVLFVDDERNVLDGLRRLLRVERTQWDMSFATGPEEALALLGCGSFDVVVSDMRMPGMDGGELLTRVRDREPSTVRIILSGQTDDASALTVAAVAHQFLRKPSDPETLKSAIARAQDLERRLGQARLRAALGGLDGLPSPSATIRALNAALSDPDADVDRLVSIIELDLGIVAKILQLVTSAFFSLPRKVASLHEAVSYLGLDALRGLAVSVEIFHALGTATGPQRLVSRLQARAMAVHGLAQEIMPGRGSPDLFIGSMLHEVGLLAVASLFPEEWKLIIERDPLAGPSAADLERQLFGATHADIGAYLLSLWGLPLSTVEIVARHHDPGLPPTGHLEAVHAVYLADALMSEIDPLPGHDAVEESLLRALGVEDQMVGWRKRRDELEGKR